MIYPAPHKRARYTPYLLTDAISVASENYVITLTTPYDSPYLLPTDAPTTLHILKKYVPLKVRAKIEYCWRKHGQIICYKNTRFYCSTLSDQDKRFYYCYGFSSISSKTRTWFLEHQHYMSQLFGWLLCLSSFDPLLYLLNLFFDCFLPVPLITPCNIPYGCSGWLFDLVLFLLIVLMYVTPAWPDS